MHLNRDSLAALFVATALVACADEPAPPESAPPAPAPPVAEVTESNCGDSGMLAARLSGALDTDLEWAGRELVCESMPRPDDRGMRLRFTGEIDGERLAIIIAMPTLEAGATGPEFDSVVTISVEGTGRFFSTPNLGTCWTDVGANAPVGDAADAYLVSGALSCVGPLGEFNGGAYIDVREMRFRSLIDWSNT